VLEVVAAEILVDGGFAGEDVPDDRDHCVRDREDRLSFAAGAEPSPEPPVVRGDVGVAAV
jgi:hypothetical protein